MAPVGSDTTRLILIRGNSGTGKSALASAMTNCAARSCVRDQPGTSSVGYIDLSARYGLDQGLHVVIEGILHHAIYGDMLRQLVTDHHGLTRCYRYDLPFEETLRRHATKARAAEFGEAEMSSWWRDTDPLVGTEERTIGAESSLGDSTRRVLYDCGWADPEELRNLAEDAR